MLASLRGYETPGADPVILSDTLMRTRTSDRLSVSEGNFECIEWLGTGKTSTSTPYYTVGDGSYVQTQDIVTDRFYSRRSRGEILMNPFVSTRIEINNPALTLRESEYTLGYGQYQTVRYTNHFTLVPKVYNTAGYPLGNWAGWKTVEDSNEMSAEVQQRALAKVGETANLVLSSIYELDETRNLLVGSCRKILSAMTHWKRKASVVARGMGMTLGRLIEVLAYNKGLTRRMAKLRDDWLAMRYGIRPLIYDVEGCLGALAKRYTSARFRTFSRLESELCTDVVPYNTVMRCGTLSGIRVSSSWNECSAGCIGDIDLDLANMYVAKIGAANLLSTAWDLIPYSFVVDWFLDISTLISAWEPDYGFTKRATWVTTVNHYRTTISAPVYSLSGGGSQREGQLLAAKSFTATKRVITRTANPVLVPLPTIKVRLSLAKITDIVALIAQLRF